VAKEEHLLEDEERGKENPKQKSAKRGKDKEGECRGEN